MIAVETRKAAGVPAIRPVDMAPTPQVKVYENRCARTISGEMFPGGTEGCSSKNGQRG